ncbi:TIGR01621 family pseudouridine synthase [Rheinheimera texasensis]|uniref:TIGR01621 family pseudouridine synthase n=1 Tax=Rheinheimera texasensis TaxID=306205 RepID=UPI000A0037AD|nr:TIGR01621 family pseudouridine synthase [Rheinheimera texasensis]
MSMPVTQSFHLLFRHADFVLVDKAAGVSFHSEDGPGLVVAVEQALGQKLYAVHRLDKVTSGLLLLATSSAAAARFTTLFSERLIDKYYLALSLTRPKQKQGWVKGDMQPARRGAYKLCASVTDPALTYFMSAGFDGANTGLPEGARAFLLKPYSGKTHQLRVALKSQGAAIAGDALYQGAPADRVYLHAYALRFDWLGESYQFVCPPTQGDWFVAAALQQKIVTDWAAPWMLAFPQLKQQSQKLKLNEKDASVEAPPAQEIYDV